MYKSCISFILSVLFLTSCVKNDIPYPTSNCQILGFGVDGQTSVKIYPDTRTVEAKIVDTLDLRNLRITQLEVTEGAEIIPDEKACLDLVNFPDTGFVSADSLPASANTRMNFLNPVQMTLRLYQDYEWTISVTHDITRIIKVKNMVGEPLVDEVNHNVVILVDSASQPSFKNIEIETLQLGCSIAETQPDPQTVTDFTRPRVFYVTAFDQTEEWTVSVRHPVGDEAKTTALYPWAKRAYIQGETKTGQVSARYRELSQSEGTEVVAGDWENVLSNEIVVNEDGTFTLTFTHLKASTTYEYELTLDGKTNPVQQFTTEDMPTVPNLSFDDWFKDGKSWYANKDLTDENYFWDSGNKGSNAVGEANPTSPESNDVISGKAARLESKTVAGVFAAGSLYAGTFGKVEGLSGASLNFGRPYTGRPSGLRGYYKYNSGVIDKVKSPYESLQGTKDSCHIYVALFTWSAPFKVNTNTGDFVDLTWNNESMVAFGELKTDQSSSDYQMFDIKLQYRDYATKPTYILIVASSSKYGDFFTGSTSSVLLLDECELVFE